MKRIHIVGVSPRTGTTLMAEAIKTCFHIDYHTNHEDRLFVRAPGQPDIFLTKSPKDIMIVGPSLKVDPDLYVICMLRDPRDIICSRHKKDPDRYWAGLKYWKRYSRAAERLKKHPRFILVRYESFVSDPDQTQQLLSERIPFLRQTALFSEYHKAATVSDSSKEALRGVRPIKPTSVGRWHNHKERIVGQIEQHGPLSDDLIRFGYEKNDDWMEELEGVEADLRPSHFPEFMTIKKSVFLKLGKYSEAIRRIIEQLIGRRIRITHPKKWLSAL
ncbi:sulfotransferase family protein [Fodinibius sediminis]|uniref:Sulfotransferase family protein n=1 Tax=Fodinibius sediminis TaxID=1214077 RepID=A0A521ABS0_9BACT|nr:sulfotransferase [Fodinibius sediminis]SMO32222.1 Sulfotransferase family protein [Fodinibius sediminis]